MKNVIKKPILLNKYACIGITKLTEKKSRNSFTVGY